MPTEIPTASTDELRKVLQDKALEPLQQGPSIRSEVRDMLPQFTAALRGSPIPAAVFQRKCLTQLNKNPKLLTCTRESVLGGFLTAAQLGLTFDLPNRVFLIPTFDRKSSLFNARFTVGYQGFIDLAYRSGEILSLDVQDVCENDDFKYWKDETGPHLHWEAPEKGAPRGQVYQYYGQANFKNGGVYIRAMTLEEIAERRKASQSSGKGGPWTTSFNAMCRKTLVRALVPFLPLRSEVAEHIAKDEAVIRVSDLSREEPPTTVEFIDVEDVTDGDTYTRGTVTTNDDSAGQDAPWEDSGVQVPDESPEPPRDTTGTPDGIPQALLDEVQAKVGGWSDAEVNRAMRQFGLTTTGSPASRRVRLYLELARRHHANTEEAAKALF